MVSVGIVEWHLSGMVTQGGFIKYTWIRRKIPTKQVDVQGEGFEGNHLTVHVFGKEQGMIPDIGSNIENGGLMREMFH
jgi:hypothetical protein